MKLSRHRFLYTALLGGTLYAPSAVAQPRFSAGSPLSEGRWVKIAVDDSGVFEITHQRLRTLGFSDPEAVAIFGRGGRQLSTDFTDAEGVPVYSDEMEQIPVTHHDGIMYFYAQGPSGISLIPDDGSGQPGFTRDWKNIYSDCGYYFLTDSREPMIMEEMPEASGSDPEFSEGWGYAYHEQDLYHNYSGTGQVFYGEYFSPDTPRREWTVHLPGAIPGEKGSMECVFYSEFRLENSRLTFGFTGASDVCSQTQTHEYLTLVPLRTRRKAMAVPGSTPKVFVEGTYGYSPEISNLDWWLVSYRRSMPDMVSATDGSRMPQDLIAFPGLSDGYVSNMRLPGGAGLLALDVTDPMSPKRLPVTRSGRDGLARISGEDPVVAVFDPLMNQGQVRICGEFSPRTPNQNLHTEAAEGADLIIICIPTMRGVAEEIAGLHRSRQGMRVIVATTEECYNEFSGGVPDPMAYRAITRLAYDSSYGCRNLLLLGPLFGDLRGILNAREPSEGIIAFQNPTMSNTRGAMNVNDFYGMMADTLNPMLLHTETVNVGVGILPVRYPAEAEIVVEKIRNYLDRTDFAHYLNLWTNISCPGDRHQHDMQILRAASDQRQESADAVVSHTVVIDAYGYAEARARANSLLTDGMLRVNYYGHGSPTLLTKEKGFFSAADINLLHNRVLPFVGVAGCTLSIPDQGIRGMGESLVVSTPNGAIGSLISSRETWASENEGFFTVFNARHFSPGPEAGLHENTVTFGDIYALAKTESTKSNDMAYHLIADPALPMPTVNRRIVFSAGESMDVVAGDRVTVSGYIQAPGGEGADASFNGEAVIRLMQPAVTLRSADICTTGVSSESDTDHTLDVTYDDLLLAMTSTPVSAGRFSATFVVPAAAASYIGSSSRLTAAAYDPATRLGAGGGAEATFIKSLGLPTACERDNRPPAIELLEFDPADCSLTVGVTDNEGLDYSDSYLAPPFRLILDGAEDPRGVSSRPLPGSDSESWTRRISLAPLAEGSHTAEVYVRDAAGNSTTATLSFDYNPPRAAYRLDTEGIGDIRSGVFPRLYMPGERPAMAEIIILDSDGAVVRRADFIDGEYVWDLRDAEGASVAPGLYRAYILETSPRGVRGHSDTVPVPVV
ncbi:MAG: hypothetical protein HDR80_02260 [Bacteroides sp.]|nr:hypothetical protein [Bacteroides sp.]